MKSVILLSIDETGKASYKHPSKLFILSSITIPEEFKPYLDKKMRRLKKKFFNREEIVFHSRDMARCKGPFSILRNNQKEHDFWIEFIELVQDQRIGVYFVIVNKKNAQRKGWHIHTVLERSYCRLLEEFVKNLGTTQTGKIISESDPSQDFSLIKAHNRLQGIGIPNARISASTYRDKITSLSLVKKSNFDIDVQLADALAPVAGLKYTLDILKSTVPMTTVERMKKHLIEQKLAKKRSRSVFTILI